MGTPYRYQLSERVYGREDIDEVFNICTVRGFDIDEESQVVYSLDNSNAIFAVNDNVQFIRKFVNNPIEHIKQSIVYGDDYDLFDYLISYYK
jgi:hypothetical protein